MSAVTLAARACSAWPRRAGAAGAAAEAMTEAMTEARTEARTGPWSRSSAGLGRYGRLVLALMFVLATGCARRPLLAPTSTAPTAASAHSELVELEKTIADNKPLLRGGSEHTSAVSPAAADSSPTKLSTGGAPSSRCDGVCRAAQEICTASRRICQISLDVADTAVAASCQRSERTCTEAGALCAQCR